MIFHEAFLGEGPEPFDPVDVDLPIGESFTVVDPFVTKAIGNQTIVTPKSIRVHQAAALHLLDGEFEKCLSFHVLHDLDPYLPSSFKDPEDRYFACGTASPFSFSPSSEIRFIEFYLSFQGGSVLSSAQDRRTKEVMKTIGGVVCQTELTGSFPNRRVQFEEFDRQQQSRKGNLRPFEDAALPNAPFPPTTVALIPLTPDATKTAATTVRTLRVRYQETMIPKIRFGGLFIVGVST
jgi:hypothetical protein